MYLNVDARQFRAEIAKLFLVLVPIYLNRLFRSETKHSEIER